MHVVLDRCGFPWLLVMRISNVVGFVDLLDQVLESLSFEDDHLLLLTSALNLMYYHSSLNFRAALSACSLVLFWLACSVYCVCNDSSVSWRATIMWLLVVLGKGGPLRVLAIYLSHFYPYWLISSFEFNKMICSKGALEVCNPHLAH